MKKSTLDRLTVLNWALDALKWLARSGYSFSNLYLICRSPSPRFVYVAQRSADLMQVLQDFPVGLEHTSLVISDRVISAEVFSN